MGVSLKGITSIGKIKAKKYSPEIFLGLGIAAGLGAVVSAYNARPKIDYILEEAKSKKEAIKEYVDDHGYSEEYTEKDHSKDLSIMTLKTGREMIKTLSPTITLGILSLTCIMTSHNIMYKRSMALTAAYEIVSRSFDMYRNEVLERFGEEVDKELRFGIKEREVEEVVTDKNGKEKIKKSKVKAPSNIDKYSTYARFFDSSSEFWLDDPTYNLTFVKNQQRYANEILQMRAYESPKKVGFLYLNEVYKMLGFEPTKEGQIVGWKYDPNGIDCEDNYVDFGIYDYKSEANRRFVNGYEDVILLDFNVDGNIWKDM